MKITLRQNAAVEFGSLPGGDFFINSGYVYRKLHNPVHNGNLEYRVMHMETGSLQQFSNMSYMVQPAEFELKQL